VRAPARQGATLSILEHRPWPLPPGGWLMAQTWEELLFSHWPLPAERVRAHLPRGLGLDTFDGEAWLGITPFRVANVRLRGLPALPRISSFLELNCRTYVSVGGEHAGIWFFSLDASSRLAVEVARRLYKLPYFRARMEGLPRYRCARVGAARPHVWESTYAPVGHAFAAEPGTLEHFLVERYCLYTSDSAGRLHRAEIHHPPWPLQQAHAEIDLNTVPPDGLEPNGEPLLHYSQRQDVLIWPLERV